MNMNATFHGTGEPKTEKPGAEKMTFLNHIQGLRGLAILLIVMYHLLPSLCLNGFLWVDVFFVISGYFLVGKQLVSDKPFSLLSFAQSKAVRILLPVLTLILITEAASVGVFASLDMLQVCRSFKMSLLGQTNQYLESVSADYFSEDTRTFPLMHLWYISVLLQCYILFALLFVLWGLLRCGKKGRIISLLVIGSTSLCIDMQSWLAAWTTFAGSTYYWTGARIWEFVLGGLLVLLPKQDGQLRSLFGAVIPLALCVLSFVPIPTAYNFTCVAAVMGAFMLACCKTEPAASVLSAAPLQWVGRISFSLYLVHWPWICLSEYILGRAIGVAEVPFLMVSMFLTAAVFYHLVEKRKAPMWVVAALCFLNYGLHTAVVKTNSLQGVLHPSADAITMILAPSLLPEPTENDVYRGVENIPNKPTEDPGEGSAALLHVGDAEAPISFVVLGDSHAHDVALGLNMLGMQHGWHGVFLDAYVVPFWGAFYGGIDGANANKIPTMFCNRRKFEAIIAWLVAHPNIKTVVIAQSWSGRMVPHRLWNGSYIQNKQDIERHRVEGSREFCRQLNMIGKNVVICTDTPRLVTEKPLSYMRSRIIYGIHTEKNPLITTKKEYDDTNACLNTAFDAMEREGLCRVIHRERSFFSQGDSNAYRYGEMLFKDSNHLCRKGILMSLDGYETELNTLLKLPVQD